MATQGQQDWSGYYDGLAGRDVRPLCVRALAEYGVVAPGASALDLGCGDGTETRALLAAGFGVTAVDSSPDSVGRLRALPEAGGSLVVLEIGMQDAELPAVDLAYSGFALPFCPPHRFDGLWAAVRAALRPGGLLACDLFGDRDDWAGPESDLTFVSRERLDGLLGGLDAVDVREVEEDGRSFSGPKHWHRFEVLARA